MMRLQKYSLVLAYFTLFAVGVVGCDSVDLSGPIASAIDGALTGQGGGCGGGCGGCGGGCGSGCASCGGCSCGSCNNCSDCGGCACGNCGSVQTLGMGTFRAQHPNGIVPNAATVRLTSPGFQFLSSQIPKIVSTALPPINVAATCAEPGGANKNNCHGRKLCPDTDGPDGPNKAYCLVDS